MVLQAKGVKMTLSFQGETQGFDNGNVRKIGTLQNGDESYCCKFSTLALALATPGSFIWVSWQPGPLEAS